MSAPDMTNRLTADPFPGFTQMVYPMSLRQHLGRTAAEVYSLINFLERGYDGLCTASNASIAAKLDLSERTVINTIGELAEHGYITSKVTGNIGKGGHKREIKTTGKANDLVDQGAKNSTLLPDKQPSKVQKCTPTKVQKSTIEVIHSINKIKKEQKLPEAVQSPAEIFFHSVFETLKIKLKANAKTLSLYAALAQENAASVEYISFVLKALKQAKGEIEPDKLTGYLIVALESGTYLAAYQAHMKAEEQRKQMRDIWTCPHCASPAYGRKCMRCNEPRPNVDAKPPESVPKIPFTVPDEYRQKIGLA